MATLTPAARQFLEQRRFAALATLNADGSPQQTTMWYELRGNQVILNTMTSRVKDRNIRRDPRISICVAEGYSYVTIGGRAQLDEDQITAHADIRRLAIRYNGEAEGNRQAETQFEKEQRVTIRLPLEHVVVANIG